MRYKKSDIEYYDIQYAAKKTNCQALNLFHTLLNNSKVSLIGKVFSFPHV